MKNKARPSLVYLLSMSTESLEAEVVKTHEVTPNCYKSSKKVTAVETAREELSNFSSPSWLVLVISDDSAHRMWTCADVLRNHHKSGDFWCMRKQWIPGSLCLPPPIIKTRGQYMSSCMLYSIEWSHLVLEVWWARQWQFEEIKFKGHSTIHYWQNPTTFQTVKNSNAFSGTM